MVLSQWLGVERYLQGSSLWTLLSLGRGGQNVQRIGRARDIEDAAYFNRFKLIAEVSRDPLRIVGGLMLEERRNPGAGPATVMPPLTR